MLTLNNCMNQLLLNEVQIDEIKVKKLQCRCTLNLIAHPIGWTLC
jgi:hypothetical protein